MLTLSRVADVYLKNKQKNNTDWIKLNKINSHTRSIVWRMRKIEKVKSFSTFYPQFFFIFNVHDDEKIYLNKQRHQTEQQNKHTKNILIC